MTFHQRHTALLDDETAITHAPNPFDDNPFYTDIVFGGGELRIGIRTLDAAARLVAAATEARDLIAQSYRPAGELTPGMQIHLPGDPHTSTVRRVTYGSVEKDPGGVIVRTNNAVRHLTIDEMVCVVPWDVPVIVGGCGHPECFDGDGHTDGCVHDDSEALIP